MPRVHGRLHAASGFVLAVCMLMPAAAWGATTRTGFVETIVATGLATPTAMAFAPDGRLFVCQQGGRLRVIKDGELLATPFLTVTVSSAGERGLLGVAFDPNFEANQYVYVYYTATTPSVHNRVSRFTATGDVAIPGSEIVLLDLNPLSSATNHNGGALHFGPDGTLYIGVGENAAGSNSQTTSNLLGKILRINADGSIPASNPFFGQTSGVNRAIWALGLRNPYTFAIEPLSGRMMINDVGADAWEEINEGLAGANYGWPATEGPTSDARFISPLYAYTHSSGCAISGGAFYPVFPSRYPSEYAGDYFFADFCSGWIRQYDFLSGIASTDFVSGLVAPVDLAIGPEGSLYYLVRGNGSASGAVGRIDLAGGKPSVMPVGRLPVPTILAPSSATRYSAGDVITFSGSATDAEDGILARSQFTWEVVFHHGAQTHPFMAPRSGETRGSFTIPRDGETSTNVWYRIRLTVTDSDGQQSTTFRDVRPKTVQLTLASSPSGLTLTLDGQPVVAPYTFSSVVGMRRSIGVVSRQILNGSTYEFRSWTDGGAPTRTFTTPLRPRGFTAAFVRVRADAEPGGSRRAVPRAGGIGSFGPFGSFGSFGPFGSFGSFGSFVLALRSALPSRREGG